MASGWLILILGCFGQLSAMNVSIPSEELELQDRLLRVLARLRLEEQFNTLLIYGNECIFHSLLRHLVIPTVVVTSGSTDFDWNFSSSTLILSCAPEADREENPVTLMKLQRTRRLISLQNAVSTCESICHQYSLKEQHNVAIIKTNFDQSDIIYSCRFFQRPNHQEVHFFADQPIYIENFRNMHGAEIRTIPDYLTPRTMMYRDKKSGESRIMGYLANVLNTYAEKVNAKVRIENATKLGVKKASVGEILRGAQEELLDIGTALASSLQVKNMSFITYPYILTGYCLMIPVPAKLPYNQVYSMIVDTVVLSIIFALFCIFSLLIVYTQNLSWRNLTLANILLNDKSLRGLLGQSFPFPPNPSKHLKLIIFILCFASVMITTMYESYLQAYFTQPPSEPYIRSFRDIANFSIKVALSRIEANVLTSVNSTHFREISKDHLLILENWPEYLILRDSFNTSFIFPVSVDRWDCYEAQQKLFSEPAFYLSDLCFNKLMFFSLPVRKYLPHRHLFEDHMMRQHEFGLVAFWKTRSFYDMVQLGLASIRDYSQKRQTDGSLLLDDISWILKLYSMAIGISICCFILEISGCIKLWERLWRCQRLRRAQ
ncbi:uncharacterized protein LOC110177077 [Drosophila serrata]|uniref:uncharacterized protein LOC110177077 n=1 Tax=Drosophila serrata TaxID=7274 RepID=UPI000A1D2083|nr:uncharacterized protein LOC110177077 [Drosophila serrata]